MVAATREYRFHEDGRVPIAEIEESLLVLPYAFRKHRAELFLSSKLAPTAESSRDIARSSSR